MDTLITHASCRDCGQPLESGNVLSQHQTSHGTVGYRECPCGRISVELVGGSSTVLGSVGPPSPNAH